MQYYDDYTDEEVVRLGQEIYDKEIRDKVEAVPENHGRFLVIDITTREYEMDEEDRVASKRALSKNPDARLYGVRIGHRAAYYLGWTASDPAPRAVR
jgi:hypothetical protein